jgi:hypothetical protein
MVAPDVMTEEQIRAREDRVNPRRLPEIRWRCSTDNEMNTTGSETMTSSDPQTVAIADLAVRKLTDAREDSGSESPSGGRALPVFTDSQHSIPVDSTRVLERRRPCPGQSLLLRRSSYETAGTRRFWCLQF